MKLKKKPVIVVSLLGVIVLVIGLVIFSINKIIFNSSKLEIIDATYTCVQGGFAFYEDEENIYSFSCSNSEKSMYVKFENGNKMLIVDALEMDVVTIDELIKADKDDKIKIQEK